MTNDEQLLNSIDTIEERLTRIEDKVDLLISQLKIEFYKKNDGTSR